MKVLIKIKCIVLRIRNDDIIYFCEIDFKHWAKVTQGGFNKWDCERDLQDLGRWVCTLCLLWLLSLVRVEFNKRLNIFVFGFWIRGRRGASTHGEDSGTCGGRGGGSGILDCLFVISQVGVEEKRWEALIKFIILFDLDCVCIYPSLRIHR